MRSNVLIPVVLGVWLCAGLACAADPPPPPPQQAETVKPVQETTVPQTPWSVRYADGSGNITRLWRDAGAGLARFETTPVSPETSSSGTYSGGDPRSGDLTPAQVEELWRRVREVEADTSNHAATRTMGSGSLALETTTGRTDFLVQRGTALAAFDSFLAQLGS